MYHALWESGLPGPWSEKFECSKQLVLLCLIFFVVPVENELGEQMWPHAERDLKYPVECNALYFNSEGKAVFREKFKRDVTSIASLTAGELTDYCLNAPKFHKMFVSHLPNLEVW